MIILLKCPFCCKDHDVKVQIAEWFNYVNGETATNAFPKLSSTEREQIISEICPDCQNTIFER